MTEDLTSYKLACIVARILDEKIAMQISGRWVVPKYRAEAQFDWDILPLPTGGAGSVSNSDSSGYAISKQTKNLQLSIDFIKYLKTHQK